MTSDYDLPAFHFLVEWKAFKYLFREIKGLEQPGKQQDGQQNFQPSMNEQHLIASKAIVLKYGLIHAGNDFDKWLQRSCIHAIEMPEHHLKISLLNEMGEPLLEWRLGNVVMEKMLPDQQLTNHHEVAIIEARLSYETIDYLPMR